MASRYMSELVGTEEQQYNRTFDVNSSANRGNALVLANGRSISGGRSRQRGRSRGRSRGQSRGRSRGQGRSRSSRGGFMGSVINQAVVPLALFGLQHSYKRRRQFNGGRRSRYRR